MMTEDIKQGAGYARAGVERWVWSIEHGEVIYTTPGVFSAMPMRSPIEAFAVWAEREIDRMAVGHLDLPPAPEAPSAVAVGCQYLMKTSEVALVKAVRDGQVEYRVKGVFTLMPLSMPLKDFAELIVE